MSVDVRRIDIHTPQIRTIPVVGPAGPVGPQGPEGPEGPAGSAGGSSIVQPFTNQSTVQVTHAFGRKPNVVVSIGGEQNWTQVEFPSNTMVTVTFPSPQTGEVIIS